MKAIGIILVVAGIVMLLFRNVSFTKEEKIVDVGPLEINKKEKKTIDWPNWAGAFAMVAGITVIIVDRKKQ